MELLNTVLGNFTGFLFVLCRITGIFTFNPIFSRRGVPNTIKVGASMLLALVMTTAGSFSYTNIYGFIIPFPFNMKRFKGPAKTYFLSFLNNALQ